MKQMIYILALFLLCSCATKKSTESTIDYSHMERIQEKMDSLMHSTKEWQQSIYEKQTSLVDSFKQSEVRDTSHVIFLGEKGDTAKEIITIRTESIIEHKTDTKESQMWQEMFYKTDSMLQAIIFRQEKTDSLYREHAKTTVVEKKPTLFDKLKWLGIGLVLGVIGLFAFATAFIKKK
ncbi:MAG: hypothetical protein IJQ60_08470 [Prevotella sp.]|nr:hypothetical protein [Prevotella sp.]